MDLSTLRYLGLIGSMIVIASSVFAALIYRGSQGEGFSVLNHFVSELGELGVSKAARLFNISLVLGGLLLLPFLTGLGLALNSWLGWLGTLAGFAAGLALAGVGIFPMNNIDRHSLAAMSFFRSGLLMIFFFGLAILFQPAHHEVVPLWASVLSLMAAGCYASFLFVSRPKEIQENLLEPLEPESVPARPKIWVIPIIEWLVFFSTIFWVIGITVSV